VREANAERARAPRAAHRRSRRTAADDVHDATWEKAASAKIFRELQCREGQSAPRACEVITVLPACERRSRASHARHHQGIVPGRDRGRPRPTGSRRTILVSRPAETAPGEGPVHGCAQAPAKNRNTSVMAGISSYSAFCPRPACRYCALLELGKRLCVALDCDRPSFSNQGGPGPSVCGP